MKPPETINMPVEKYNGYLTYMNYSATGEGMTAEINFCYTNTPEKAKELHMDRFIGVGPTFQSAREYFGIDIDVMPFDSDKAKKILTQFFVDGESLHKHLKTS
jgi:hypothetical protein